MNVEILLQILVGICFLGLVFTLFIEKLDYLTFSIFWVIVAIFFTFLFDPAPPPLEEYILAIEWEIVIFLISMFVIVEVLNEKMIFHQLAKWIVKRTSNNVRALFWTLCIVSTLIASILEDLSVALIFIPVIIITCYNLKINPMPFLLGMTICINLASTLTPFGSAENILIANHFDKGVGFFLVNFGSYFVVATFCTLFLLDRFVLTKEVKKAWNGACEEHESLLQSGIMLSDIHVDRKNFITNLIALGIFVLLLLFVPGIHISGVIGMILFVFLNPIENKKPRKKKAITDENKPKSENERKGDAEKPIESVVMKVTLGSKLKSNSKEKNGLFSRVFGANKRQLTVEDMARPKAVQEMTTMKMFGKKNPRISHYFRKVDYKLVYFFICLFIMVFLMEKNGTVLIIEDAIEMMSLKNIFLLSVIVLVGTSLLSGLMDNAPVTVIFLPIMEHLINAGFAEVPLLLAFVLGINLGGNFLPQGSAADMLTLEMAEQYCVPELNYKKLTKVGGLFALLHIILGIGYLAFLIFVLGIGL